ncbi:MAG: TPR domain-containing protein [Candidatus Magnetoglobus multicellularis str. Araruama]|uniref:TPR domain-containing protein n=1 Tax=Candidatus Magnetoglobus multicellularis str. Araruama TaxID=890399 RepID=A0A1V1NZP2_9BACT|nr:MAG: TPR domain-containing protein [Candidatus Magnetoglobus multicellularis str. Araruama]
MPLLKSDPTDPKLWHLYGIIAARQQHTDLAINSLNKASSLSPNNGIFLFNLANAYRQAKLLDQSIATYEQALQFSQDKRPVSINYGIALKENGLYDKALTVFHTILNNHANDVQAYNNMGNVFTEMGQYTPAMAYYEKALQLNPDDEEAHRNKALLLLIQGNLKQGFEEYEWRFVKNGVPLKRNLKPPLWDGSDLSGCHIFVWGEQGLGDEICFASVFPELIQKAKEVSIECAPRLQPIFKRSFPETTVVPFKKDPANEPSHFSTADFHCPSGSLMRYLRTSFDQFHKQTGYLKADPAKVRAIKARYHTNDNKIKVGISWTSAIDYDHPAKLKLWRPILSCPNVQFYNLQYGDCLAEIEQVEKDFNITIINDPDIDPLKNIDDQAAQIQSMDIIISIGGTTAQLAGALGKTVWVILPLSSDWHWFSKRDDSPWYPGMRFFRQPVLKDWESVIGNVSNALKQWIQQ